MSQQDNPGKAESINKILQIAMIISVIIYAIILFIFVPPLDLSIFPSGDPTLTLITIILAVVGVISLTLGYFIPPWIAKSIATGTYVLGSICVVRMALLESVAIFGLILGIMGVEWYVSLPFMVVSVVMLVITFPTKANMSKLAEKYADKIQGS